jgi:hypothetical protein
MSKIFQDPSKEFMLVSNSLIDDLMPILPATAFKIICLIYRKTKGWNKDTDKISFSQIMKGTGIKSTATVAKHLDILVNEGCIIRERMISTWEANNYSLNLEFDSSTLKNEVGSTLKNEVGSTLKNEDTKDIVKKQETHMPQSGENDFSDLFGNQSSSDTKPQNGKPKLTEAEKAHLQTFGVLPDQAAPEAYAIRQEINTAGWHIHSPDVEMAIAYFVLAVRSCRPEFALPNDTSTRKLWYKEVAGHLQNYSLDRLQSLYKKAIIKMEDAELSFWQPGSLTKWALPEVANTRDGGTVRNHSYNPNLTPEQLAALREFQTANQIK